MTNTVASSDPRADVLAERVIASLDGVPADELYALAEGFRFAGGPVSWFFNPIFSLAIDREEHDEYAGNFSVRIAMRVALKSAARDGSLLARLEGNEQPFWAAVYEALTELSGRSETLTI